MKKLNFRSVLSNSWSGRAVLICSACLRRPYDSTTSLVPRIRSNMLNALFYCIDLVPSIFLAIVVSRDRVARLTFTCSATSSKHQVRVFHAHAQRQKCPRAHKMPQLSTAYKVTSTACTFNANAKRTTVISFSNPLSAFHR